MMTIFIGIMYLVLPLVVLSFEYKRHTKEEKFILKWIGYYVLGAFTLTVNQFILPIGFVVYFLFFRNPKQNKGLKRTAAMVGLAFFFIQWASPAIAEKWYERAYEIEIEEGNIHDISFQETWGKVAEMFNIQSGSPRLNRYEVEYEKDGKITRMDFEIVDREQEVFVHYQLSYQPGDQTLVINRFRTDSWLQFDRLIGVSTYLSDLDALDLKALTEKHAYSSYSIEGEGERGSFAVKDWENYVVEDDELVKVENYELPIEGFLLRLSGKGKDGFETQYLASYFLHATYNPKESGPYSAEDAIAVLRGDERVNTWMDDHLVDDNRKQENGAFYRKYQEEWQKVSEEEYNKKIEPFVESEELLNQEWHITYTAKFGEPPYRLTGVVSRETGEILEVRTE